MSVHGTCYRMDVHFCKKHSEIKTLNENCLFQKTPLNEVPVTSVEASEPPTVTAAEIVAAAARCRSRVLKRCSSEPAVPANSLSLQLQPKPTRKYHQLKFLENRHICFLVLQFHQQLSLQFATRLDRGNPSTHGSPMMGLGNPAWQMQR